MKNITIITLCFAISLLTFGCNQPKGSFDLAPRKITIITEPEGAEVLQKRPLGQSSTKLGTTPINELTVNVMTNIKYKNMPFNETQELLNHRNNVVVTIKKEGYKQYYGILSTKAGETSVHNIKLQPVEE